MKTLLICPDQASGIPALADSHPAALLPLLGESFLGYWLRHLAEQKFDEVRIIASDSAELLQAHVGDGSRWGIQAIVRSESRELTAAEARERHRESGEEGWPAEPNDLIEADHLPGFPDHALFSGYRAFFEALSLWMPRVVASGRIGLREERPGVWIGRKANIARTAVFKAPCWIGDHARIGKNSLIGPNSFVEERVVVDQNCEVVRSWVAPDTFVGALTHVNESLARGEKLINWRTGSHISVPDSFLLSSLTGQAREQVRSEKANKPAVSRSSKLFAPLASLAQKAQG